MLTDFADNVIPKWTGTAANGTAGLLTDSKRSINVNAVDSLGYTALARAARLGYADIVRELVKHPDIDVNISDNEGTPMMQIAKRLDPRFYSFLQMKSMHRQ